MELMRRRRSGTAMASSRSTTRPKASRTSAKFLLVCSARSRMTFACSRPMWAARSVPACARSFRWCSPCSARSHSTLGARRADAPADVRARLPAGVDRARRARRQIRGTLDAVVHEAIASPRATRISRATITVGRARSTSRRTRDIPTSWLSSTLRRRATCARRARRPASSRSNARWTSSPWRSSSIRSSCG